ncbi:MAG: hypothetical protein FJ008_02350 [Chloroflexi bacterium]|nr:hypothetical protein [Chloroflexota bacterium]MBM3173012.1 hypothetical protein [Chloroflexota bacterium]MBM3174985.1 hypothetical protein [Chloroflexota bacterium]MBM4449759.1 hypothetical protein [Chloroflexota bacterium]
MPERKVWKGESLERYGAAQPKFSWVKLFLFVLSLACDAAVLWAIILLVTGRISHVPGTVLLVAAVACSLSGKSLWRRPMVGVGAVVIMFVIVVLLIVLLCAFSGIEPFASAKNYLAALIHDFGRWVMDKLRLALEYLRELLPDGR